MFKSNQDQFGGLCRYGDLHKTNRAGLLVKRSNHSKETSNYLKEWMRQHLEWPYPTDKEKKGIIQDTGLTVTQVNDWCINFRRRRQFKEMCRKYGVDPEVSIHKRKDSKGSRSSSPKSEDKENDVLFPGTCLNEQDQYGVYPRASSCYQTGSIISQRSSSKYESKTKDVPYPVPDGELNQKYNTNFYMLVKVACLEQLYWQSETQFQDGLSRDEWVEKMFNQQLNSL